MKSKANRCSLNFFVRISSKLGPLSRRIFPVWLARSNRQPPDKSVRRRVARANVKDHEILRSTVIIAHCEFCISDPHRLDDDFELGATTTTVGGRSLRSHPWTSDDVVQTLRHVTAVPRRSPCNAPGILDCPFAPRQNPRRSKRCASAVFIAYRLCGVLLRRVGGQMRVATRPDATSRRFARRGTRSARIVPRASISLVSSFCCVHALRTRCFYDTPFRRIRINFAFVRKNKNTIK